MMQALEPIDRAELTKLVNAVALTDRSLSIFAIAPDSAPNHPVVEQFKAQLRELDEPFVFHNLYYSDDSLFNFLHRLDGEETSGRRVVMAFGLEYLPRYRLQQEMQQLNLGRERIFDRNIVLVFWLSRETFLNEFRQQAVDFWDWRGNVAVFTTRPPSNPLLYPYLEWLIAENSYLKVAGVMQVNRQVDILLDRIYISLQAESVEERSQSFRERVTRGEGRVTSSRANKMGEPDFPDIEFMDEPMLTMSAEPTSSQRVTKIVDLAEALRKHTYSAILGEPGAGKTTLLRYLARHFAIAYRGIEANESSVGRVLGGMGEDLGEMRLPVLFRIADFAERLAQEPDLSLVEYLKQFYRQWESDRDRGNGDAVADLLLSKMAAGDCLVLMDGLDEVFDRANRVQVVQQIDRLVKEYSENKFVITSRIAGYQEASLGSRFRELTITPMANAQIKEFLKRWCRAIEEAQRPEADVSLHERDAEREARGILQAIETKPGVSRFATNPLLLTILALIHRNGTQMPQRRVELYQLATKTLIEDWQSGRNIAYGVQHKQLLLVEDEVTALLAPLAFQMHEEKPSGLVTQGEVETWLTPRMAESQGVEEPEALELVRQFLRKVRETTGLFVERAPAVYGFMHLTFEEYYAARYIADNEINRILAIVESKMSDQRWEEPILLALSFLNERFPQQSKRLIESLFRDIIQLGDDMRPKRKFRHLNAFKAKLIKIENRLSKKNKFGVLDTLINYSIGSLHILFELVTRFTFVLQISRISSDSDYSAKLILGLEVVLDIQINYLQRSQLLHSLFAAKSIIDFIELERLSWLPNLFDKYIQKYKQKILSLKLFSNRLTVKHREFQSLEMTYSILEYCKVVVNNVLLPEAIRNTMQKNLIDISVDNTPSTSDNLNDLVESLNLSISERNRAIAYWQAGRAYQQKNKYEQAIYHYQQSCELWQQLKQDEVVGNLWYALSDCYQDWSKYEQALDSAQKLLLLRQKLKDQSGIAEAYWKLGRSYQNWGKYKEAIDHYQQSRDLWKKLERDKVVGNLWYWLSDCYRNWCKYEQALDATQQELALRQQLDDRPNIAYAYRQLGRIYQDWEKYEEAIAHHEQSREIYQQLDQTESLARQLRRIANSQRLLARETADRTPAISLLTQAEQHLEQAIQLNIDRENRKNLAYDYIALSLVCSDFLRHLPADDATQSTRIAQFEDNYAIGLGHFTALGQTVNLAEETLDIARAYLEIPALENLDFAESLTRQSLQTFQEFNRRRLQADALKLLGEIYKHRLPHQPDAAAQFFLESRQLYQELDLTEKAIEIDSLW